MSRKVEGRIGPNAVTRLAEALDELSGARVTDTVFGAAGLLRYRQEPPSTMVDEAVVTALHAALRHALAPADATAVARRAGALTGDYLLAHRIPAPVRALLRALPAPWAARLLVRAMSKHAWTFAGSGAFSAVEALRVPGPAGALRSGGVRVHPRLQLVVAGCPLCRASSTPAPVCDYFAATFERLFTALVASSATVRETDCQATGSSACRFQVGW